MSPTDHAVRTATCSNVADCPKALAGEALEWYPGAGEYCPECGEALTPVDATPHTPEIATATETGAGFPPSGAARENASRSDATTVDAAAVNAARTNGSATNGAATHGAATNGAAVDAATASTATQNAPTKNAAASNGASREPSRPSSSRIAARSHAKTVSRSDARAGLDRRQDETQRRIWVAVVGCLLVAIVGAAIYTRRGSSASARVPADVTAVCAVPSAQELAAGLVRGYADKTATPASQFVISNAGPCDVSFSSVAQSPDAIIARDGIVAVVNPLNPIARISEQQLRAIYSGAIRNWSQLGGPPGEIVPILPAADSDEAKALASSLFFGVALDRGVQHRGSSADVTRAVSGADRAGRAAIGLVTFSQAVPAKVVPLAYWPPPSVLSIGTRRYPYTLAIAVEPGSGSEAPAAAESLIDYARSADGAAIVLKSGLIPTKGF